MTTKVVQGRTPHGDPEQFQAAIITLIYDISARMGDLSTEFSEALRARETNGSLNTRNDLEDCHHRAIALRNNARQVIDRIYDMAKSMNISEADLADVVPTAKVAISEMLKDIDRMVGFTEETYRLQLNTRREIQQIRSEAVHHVGQQKPKNVAKIIAAVLVGAVMIMGGAALGFQLHPRVSIDHKGNVRTHVNFR